MVQASNGCIVVWDMFSWYTVGHLFAPEGQTHFVVYLSIIVVHTAMLHLCPGGHGYFQDDNSPT